MNRRELLQRTTLFSLVGTFPFSLVRRERGGLDGAQRSLGANADKQAVFPRALNAPAEGSIPVAFLISEGAVVIDFCGPWGVFQDVSVPGRGDNAFRLYTVSETTKPIRTSGGMKIIPDYDLKTAPAPKVLVIPAQSGRSEAMLEWIRESTKNTDVTMSVCTGAFLLARTGLLSAKTATTFHAAFREFAAEFPDIQVKRGARFVEQGNLATAAGLSSGIDLALRVVERYYGRDIATKTAYDMEYQGQGWLNPDSNEVYAKARTSTDQHPICPVCDMEVDPKTALKSTYQGKTYYFCMNEHALSSPICIAPAITRGNHLRKTRTSLAR